VWRGGILLLLSDFAAARGTSGLLPRLTPVVVARCTKKIQGC
jgi:hypothetical protein